MASCARTSPSAWRRGRTLNRSDNRCRNYCRNYCRNCSVALKLGNGLGCRCSLGFCCAIQCFVHRFCGWNSGGGAADAALFLCSLAAPRKRGTALAAEPEPHDKAVRLSPDGRRPLVLALVPSLIRATPGQRCATASKTAPARCLVACGNRLFRAPPVCRSVLNACSTLKRRLVTRAKRNSRVASSNPHPFRLAALA